jgi:hypothetical protein
VKGDRGDRKIPPGDRGTTGQEQEVNQEQGEGLSLWDLLRDEVGVEDWDGWIVDGKWERIANFLAVPLAVEKASSGLLGDLHANPCGWS